MSVACASGRNRAGSNSAGHTIDTLRIGVLVGSLALLPAAGWAAGGISLPFKNVPDSALGFAAGVTLRSTPESAYLNPAGLADLSGPVLSFGATVVALETRFHGVARADDTANAAFIPGSKGGNPGGVSAIPGVALARPLGEHVGIGLALTADGIDFQYRDDWVGRYHGIDTRIQVPTLSLALGFRVRSGLTFGLGARLQYIKADLLDHIDLGRALELQIAQRCPAMLPASDLALPGLVDVEGLAPLLCGSMAPDGDLSARYDFSNRLLADAFGIGWHAGLQWSPRPGTRLGLAYFSPVSQRLEGRAQRHRFGPGHDGEPGWDAAELRSDPDLAGIRLFLDSRALATGSPDFDELVVATAMSHSADGRIRSTLSYPEGVSAGIRQGVGEHLALYAAGHWTRWSRLDELRVSFSDGRPAIARDLGLSDSTMFSAGLEIRQQKRVYRLGFAHESGADTVRRRVTRAPDGDRRHFTAGLGWTWSPRLQLDFAAGYAIVDARQVHEIEAASGHLLTGPLAAPRVISGALRVLLTWP